MGMRIREATVLAVTTLLLAVGVPAATAAGPPAGPPAGTPAGTATSGAARAEGPVATAPPAVTGTAQRGRTLRTDGGTWAPAEVTRTYRWLRDGRAIRGATATTYRLATNDVGHRIVSEVTATDSSTDGAGAKARATSEPTATVRPSTFTVRQAPQVLGTARFGRTLTARVGDWSPHPARVTYRWFRGPSPIAGARSSRYVLTPSDVGRRVSVEVTGEAAGYAPRAVRSATVLVRHRVDVRRTVTYSVRTDGRITADLAEFTRLAQETYDDARGWRGSGVSFRRVSSGGSFTLVLAEASRLPSYDPICSAQWSCRAGRFVVINQTRWQHASPAWNAARGSLRNYRHMVVNHETGHWLGNGHAGCPRRGALAPVMMQQSKGLGGCVFNPWPTTAELG